METSWYLHVQISHTFHLTGASCPAAQPRLSGLFGWQMQGFAELGQFGHRSAQVHQIIHLFFLKEKLFWLFPCLCFYFHFSRHFILRIYFSWYGKYLIVSVFSARGEYNGQKREFIKIPWWQFLSVAGLRTHLLEGAGLLWLSAGLKERGFFPS